MRPSLPLPSHPPATRAVLSLCQHIVQGAHAGAGYLAKPMALSCRRSGWGTANRWRGGFAANRNRSRWSVQVQWTFTMLLRNESRWEEQPWAGAGTVDIHDVESRWEEQPGRQAPRLKTRPPSTLNQPIQKSCLKSSEPQESRRLSSEPGDAQHHARS